MISKWRCDTGGQGVMEAVSCQSPNARNEKVDSSKTFYKVGGYRQAQKKRRDGGPAKTENSKK